MSLEPVLAGFGITSAVEKALGFRVWPFETTRPPK
jgi:hypothetical protein